MGPRTTTPRLAWEGVVAVEGKDESSLVRPPIRFDLFELDAKSGQLRRSG